MLSHAADCRQPRYLRSRAAQLVSGTPDKRRWQSLAKDWRLVRGAAGGEIETISPCQGLIRMHARS